MVIIGSHAAAASKRQEQAENGSRNLNEDQKAAVKPL